MVRQWQEMFYDERYSEVYLSPDSPDYVMWAEAMGCVGIRVESPEEVEPAIEKANSINDRPVVVEFRVDCQREGVPDGPRRRRATTTSCSTAEPDVDERSVAMMNDQIEHTEHRRSRRAAAEPVAWAGRAPARRRRHARRLEPAR